MLYINVLEKVSVRLFFFVGADVSLMFVQIFNDLLYLSVNYSDPSIISSLCCRLERAHEKDVINYFLIRSIHCETREFIFTDIHFKTH